MPDNDHVHYFRDGHQQGDTRGARQEFLAMAVELLVIVTTIRLVTSVAYIFMMVINKKTCEERDRSFINWVMTGQCKCDT